jgi:hypothetical protein
MVLCDVCQKIDVREMLLIASVGHTEGDGNMESECRYCSVLDNGIPHHDDYTALEAASDHGCDFCRMIRESLVEGYGGDNCIPGGISHEEDERFSGPVIFFPYNLEGWLYFKGEPPKIEIRVGFASRSRTDPYLSCDFEAFAPYGMLIRGSQAYLTGF